MAIFKWMIFEVNYSNCQSIAFETSSFETLLETSYVNVETLIRNIIPQCTIHFYISAFILNFHQKNANLISFNKLGN